MSIANVGIRWRLIATIVAMIVPIVVLVFVNARNERDRMVSQTHAEVMAQAQVIAAAHNQVLRTVHQLLIELSADPALRDFHSPACNEIARRLTAASGAYSNIAVSGLGGIVHCSANPAGINLLVADSQYYIDALAEEGITTSGYLFGRISGKPVDVFATAIRDPDGRPLGVIELSVDIGWLGQLVELQELSREVRTTIVGPAGYVLARVPSDALTVGTLVKEAIWAADVMSTRQARNTELQLPDHPLMLAAIVPLVPLGEGEDPPAYVLVTTPKAAAVVPADAAFRRNLIVLAMVTAVGVVWAWSVSMVSVHHPVRALVRATREYARGSLRVRVGLPSLSSSEMVELATAFEVMADTVAADQETLRHNATTDMLTGLPNRMETERLIDEQLQHDPHRSYALVEVQLRQFGAVNASFGFEGGDDLLRQIGPRLIETFGEQTLAGRTGGDEFMALVQGDTEGEDISSTEIAVAIERAFERPFYMDDEPVYLGARQPGLLPRRRDEREGARAPGKPRPASGQAWSARRRRLRRRPRRASRRPAEAAHRTPRRHARRRPGALLPTAGGPPATPHRGGGGTHALEAG